MEKLCECGEILEQVTDDDTETDPITLEFLAWSRWRIARARFLVDRRVPDYEWGEAIPVSRPQWRA